MAEVTFYNISGKHVIDDVTVFSYRCKRSTCYNILQHFIEDVTVFSCKSVTAGVQHSSFQ